jgi:GH25 family lysozyme M1 (1,4-beta-N-acetylmuramidase)
MKELSDYMLWVSNPLIEGDSIPRFYYAHDIWQYTTDASVPGVEGPVDVNLMFVPKTE